MNQVVMFVSRVSNASGQREGQQVQRGGRAVEGGERGDTAQGQPRAEPPPLGI